MSYNIICLALAVIRACVCNICIAIARHMTTIFLYTEYKFIGLHATMPVDI